MEVEQTRGQQQSPRLKAPWSRFTRYRHSCQLSVCLLLLCRAECEVFAQSWEDDVLGRRGPIDNNAC
jgi:hypothetical protein